MKGNFKNDSIRGILRELELGAVTSFPGSRASYVKSVCVSLGFELGKKFSTSIDRKNNLILVTRKI